MVTRIKTTMIGAIDTIQKEFQLEIESDQEFKKRFLKIREKILDIGNNQIRLEKKDQENE